MAMPKPAYWEKERFEEMQRLEDERRKKHGNAQTDVQE